MTDGEGPNDGTNAAAWGPQGDASALALLWLPLPLGKGCFLEASSMEGRCHTQSGPDNWTVKQWTKRKGAYFRYELCETGKQQHKKAVSLYSSLIGQLACRPASWIWVYYSFPRRYSTFQWQFLPCHHEFRWHDQDQLGNQSFDFTA